MPAGDCGAPTTCSSSGSCAIAVPAHPCQRDPACSHSLARDPPVALQVRGRAPHTHTEDPAPLKGVETSSGCVLSPRGPCNAQRMWDAGSSQRLPVLLFKLKISA